MQYAYSYALRYSPLATSGNHSPFIHRGLPQPGGQRIELHCGQVPGSSRPSSCVGRSGCLQYSAIADSGAMIDSAHVSCHRVGAAQGEPDLRLLV